MAVALGGVRSALLRRSMASPIRIAVSLKSSSSSSPARPPAFAPLSRRNPSRGISRILPVELGCAQSLMPFHSATASALLNSMVCIKRGGWAWLLDGNWTF